MCKKECKACKCRRGTPQEIVTGIDTVIDIEELVDYDDIKYSKLIPSTTSPHWKGNNVEEGSVAQGEVIFNLFIGGDE